MKTPLRHREYKRPAEDRNKPDGMPLFRAFLAPQRGEGPTRGPAYDARKRHRS